MTYNIGDKNRFGGAQFDPFARFNHDFKTVFDPNKGPEYKPSFETTSGHKTCTSCKKPKPMLGGTNKGGKVFVCAECK